MRKNQAKEVLYLVIDKEKNTHAIRKYLPKVEKIVGVSSSTLSKHFNKYVKPYETEQYLVYKCLDVDTKGAYRGNFR